MKCFWCVLSSTYLTVGALLFLAALTVWGTLYQIDYGLYAAQERFFRSWVVSIGGIVPFPGVYLSVVIAVCTICAGAISRFSLTWKSAGSTMMRMGIALLLVGITFTPHFSHEGSMALQEGQESKMVDVIRDSRVIGHHALPLTIKLIEFKQKDYPGTRIAQSYISRVLVKGVGVDKEVSISMNRPFRYQNITFYQSGHFMNGNTAGSEFMVVQNSAGIIPYVATVLMSVGVLIHFWCFVLSCSCSRRMQKSVQGMRWKAVSESMMFFARAKFIYLGVVVCALCIMASILNSMGTRAPVLNNIFWLFTHITTIVLGYVGCIAAGVVGHVYLIQRIVMPLNTLLHRSTARMLIGVLSFGLTFTFMGTLLGGMWADQSWGRFWGWDPKENGALLVILWNATLMRARSDKIIHDRGLAVGAIILLMVVLCAWIGVNMLGLGLHAYAFSSTSAQVLLGTILLECMFLLIALPFSRSKSLA